MDEFGGSRRHESDSSFESSPLVDPTPMATGATMSKKVTPFDSETHMRKATETDRRLLTAQELQSCDQNERALDLYTTCIEEFEELECFLHDKPMSVGVLPEQVFAARYNRGLVYRALGRYEDAVRDIQKALSLPSKRITDEDRLKARFARGLVNFECRNVVKAMEDIDFITHADPTHAGAFLIRALIHHMEGRMEEAVEECTKALSLAQKKLNPAYIYILRGDSYKYWPGYHQQESLEDYEKAMDLYPSLADRFIGRGFRWPDDQKDCGVKRRDTTTFLFIEELLSESDYLHHPIRQMAEYRPPPPPPTKDPLEMETIRSRAVMETNTFGGDDEDELDIDRADVGASDKENRRARSGSLLTADVLSQHNRQGSFQRRFTTESAAMSPLERFAASQSTRVDQPSLSKDDVAQLPWRQSVEREYRQPWKEKHSILRKETSQIEMFHTPAIVGEPRREYRRPWAEGGDSTSSSQRSAFVRDALQRASARSESRRTKTPLGRPIDSWGTSRPSTVSTKGWSLTYSSMDDEKQKKKANETVRQRRMEYARTLTSSDLRSQMRTLQEQQRSGSKPQPPRIKDQLLKQVQEENDDMQARVERVKASCDRIQELLDKDDPDDIFQGLEIDKLIASLMSFKGSAGYIPNAFSTQLRALNRETAMEMRRVLMRTIRRKIRLSKTSRGRRRPASRGPFGRSTSSRGGADAFLGVGAFASSGRPRSPGLFPPPTSLGTWETESMAASTFDSDYMSTGGVDGDGLSESRRKRRMEAIHKSLPDPWKLLLDDEKVNPQIPLTVDEENVERLLREYERRYWDGVEKRRAGEIDRGEDEEEESAGILDILFEVEEEERVAHEGPKKKKEEEEHVDEELLEVQKEYDLWIGEKDAHGKRVLRREDSIRMRRNLMDESLRSRSSVMKVKKEMGKTLVEELFAEQSLSSEKRASEKEHEADDGDENLMKKPSREEDEFSWMGDDSREEEDDDDGGGDDELDRDRDDMDSPVRFEDQSSVDGEEKSSVLQGHVSTVVRGLRRMHSTGGGIVDVDMDVEENVEGTTKERRIHSVPWEDDEAEELDVDVVDVHDLEQHGEDHAILATKTRSSIVDRAKASSVADDRHPQPSPPRGPDPAMPHGRGRHRPARRGLSSAPASIRETEFPSENDVILNPPPPPAPPPPPPSKKPAIAVPRLSRIPSTAPRPQSIKDRLVQSSRRPLEGFPRAPPEETATVSLQRQQRESGIGTSVLSRGSLTSRELRRGATISSISRPHVGAKKRAKPRLPPMVEAARRFRRSSLMARDGFSHKTGKMGKMGKTGKMGVPSPERSKDGQLERGKNVGYHKTLCVVLQPHPRN